MAFANYTKEELVKKLKTQQKMFFFKIVVVFLLILVSAYQTYIEGFSFNTLLPLLFIPMSIYMYMELKKIQKELASRK